MKILLRTIIISSLLVLGSCSKDELHIPEKGRQVEFVVRQTSFIGIDVSSVSTKALTDTELTETESLIASLYFLVFDEAGNRIEDEFIALDPASQMSRTIYGRGPLTVCYLANVPYSYANSITHIDRLKDTPLPITYAPETETGYIGIPQMTLDLNRDRTDETATRCFPMIGMETYPGAEVTSGVVEIDLKRVFAKVVVRLKTDFDADWGALFDAPEINLYSYTLYNLPTNVMLSPEAMTDSPWVGYPDTQSGRKYFEEPKEIDMDDITVNNTLILQTYTTVLTCYIPEYYLSPKSSAASNTDQRLKPLMYDLSKRPVYLTINAHTHQSNFVDVPLKYYLYFGENAVNDFNLLRNCQYNNNMTITGTGDAILGTDDRVEATYHNLADPNNTGSPNPANCYIISKPGRYLIPTYIGNQVSGGTKAGTVAEQLSLNGSADNKITNITLVNKDGKQYIQFDVNMYASDGTFSPTEVAGGNKLLVLKNGSNVVWSWHLWMCEDQYRPDVTYHQYPSTNAIVMDRSLGAIHRNGLGSSLLQINLTYWDDCLYFQWGRKDPMLASDTAAPQTEGNYANSKQNPRVFFEDWTASEAGWNANLTNGKSVDDPCPPGYKVPSNAIWRNSGNNSTGLEEIVSNLGVHGYPYSIELTSAVQNNILYPFVGYLGDDEGTPSGIGKTTTPISDQKLEESIVVLYYNGSKQEETGQFWANGGKFQYIKSEVEITSTEIFIHASDRWFPANPNNSPRPNGLVAGGSTPLNTQIKNTTTYKNLNFLAKLAVDTALAIVDMDDIALGLLNLLPSSGYKETHVTSVAEPAHGMQLRCVREDSPTL